MSAGAGLVCAACGTELPAAFPGASVVCGCGVRAEVAPPRSHPPSQRARSSRGPSGQPDGGPYRSAATSNEPEPSATCPFCSNEVPAMVRICPHCDVRLENVRCQRCFSLQAPGAFTCARCGKALELEPLLDATDAPCPRCVHPLEVSPGEDSRVHECPRCGGMFVPREVLAEILCSAELGGALREAPSRPARESGGWSVDVGPAPPLDVVRYVPCPLCHSSMNRVNFGRVSGVIIDVCRAHGTWFDAGELTRVVAFAAGGGLEKTREREREEQKATSQRAREVHVQLETIEARDQLRTRLDMWHDFLRAIFVW